MNHMATPKHLISPKIHERVCGDAKSDYQRIDGEYADLADDLANWDDLDEPPEDWDIIFNHLIRLYLTEMAERLGFRITLEPK